MSVKIVVPYLVAGGAWILLSDRFVAATFQDVAVVTAIQTYKGWFYVAMSGLLGYLLSHRYLSRLLLSSHELEESHGAVMESQRAMETLLSNLPGNGMAYRYKVGPVWDMVYVSAGCLALTGYEQSDLLGCGRVRYRDLILPEDVAHAGRTIDSALAGGGAFHCEYRIRAKDGKERWVWEQGRGVYGNNGTVVAVEGYVFDVSEQRRLKEELRGAERLRHVGEAASTIIHDIKNQMQVIRGHVDLYRMAAKGEREIRLCNLIDSQVNSMLSMSRELLDYARGEIALDRNRVDMHNLLQRLLETYEPTFEREGIGLVLEWRQEGAGAAELDVDEGRIMRALMNLIGNAREAVRAGGRISLRGYASDSGVEIQVQDDGPGIPERIREVLFDPFVTCGKAEGTGLGLAITKKIIEAHGGEIAFETKTGVGTTFSIRLPRENGTVARKNFDRETALAE